jgi:excisionase family DNA binding protein
MSALKDYLTMAEAAARLEMSYEQLTRYVVNGKIAHVQIGHQKLIHVSALENFIRTPRGNPAFQQKKPSEKKIRKRAIANGK